MNKIAEIGVLRLEKVLLKDKTQNPKIIVEMLRSELKNLFLNYMELTNLDINFVVCEGKYELKINAEATRIKALGSL